MGDVHQNTYQDEAVRTRAAKDKVGGGGSGAECEDFLSTVSLSRLCQKAVKFDKGRSVRAAAVRVKATLVNSNTVIKPSGAPRGSEEVVL